jgi:DNA-binding beta-propeller fold protein YncE
VLVSEAETHRVSQFALDGTFIGIFAGTGDSVFCGSSCDGEFDHPRGIAVLGSSGEVAVADRNNYRVQIFDSEGKYKRQFGTSEGKADGQFFMPSGIASDAHGNLLVTDWTNRLQVFSPEGKHLCTSSDLRLHGCTDLELAGLATSSPVHYKGIAWSISGEIAVADQTAHTVLVWHST